MPIEKPKSIAADEFKSAKWDELTEGREFARSDIPTLTLLVQWHAVIDRCIKDMDASGGRVAYQNDMGDLKAYPQIATMKQASAEIRALNAQLKINDEAKSKEEETRGGTKLYAIISNRQARSASAENIA